MTDYTSLKKPNESKSNVKLTIDNVTRSGLSFTLDLIDHLLIDGGLTFGRFFISFVLVIFYILYIFFFWGKTNTRRFNTRQHTYSMKCYHYTVAFLVMF